MLENVELKAEIATHASEVQLLKDQVAAKDMNTDNNRNLIVGSLQNAAESGAHLINHIVREGINMSGPWQDDNPDLARFILLFYQASLIKNIALIEDELHQIDMFQEQEMNLDGPSAKTARAQISQKDRDVLLAEREKILAQVTSRETEIRNQVKADFMVSDMARAEKAIRSDELARQRGLLELKAQQDIAIQVVKEKNEYIERVRVIMIGDSRNMDNDNGLEYCQCAAYVGKQRNNIKDFYFKNGGMPPNEYAELVDENDEYFTNDVNWTNAVTWARQQAHDGNPATKLRQKARALLTLAGEIWGDPELFPSNDADYDDTD